MPAPTLVSGLTPAQTIIASSHNHHFLWVCRSLALQQEDVWTSKVPCPQEYLSTSNMSKAGKFYSQIQEG